MNLFADLTQDEFAATYTGLKPESLWSDLPRLGTHEYSGAALASSVDWTTQGAVTPVKNQPLWGALQKPWTAPQVPWIHRGEGRTSGVLDPRIYVPR